MSSLLLAAALSAPLLSFQANPGDDPPKPSNGGIDWTSLSLCMRKITLETGDCIMEPVKWQPYVRCARLPNGTKVRIGPFYEYYGY